MKKVTQAPFMTISKQSCFEMAHRLTCAQTEQCNTTVHGHSYKWIMSISGQMNPETYMMVDFKNISRLMREMENVVEHALWIPSTYAESYSTDRKVLVTHLDPTAEVMATIFCLTACHELFNRQQSCTMHLQAVKITLFETEGSSIEVAFNRDNFQAYMSSFPLLWVLNRTFRKLGVEV